MLLIRDTEIIFFCFNCIALLWWDKNAWEDAIQFWKAVTMTFVVILFNQIKTTIKSQITVGNPVNDAFLQQVKTKKCIKIIRNNSLGCWHQRHVTLTPAQLRPARKCYKLMSLFSAPFAVSVSWGVSWGVSWHQQEHQLQDIQYLSQNSQELSDQYH